MMTTSFPHIIFLLVLLMCFRGTLESSSGSRCSEGERQALLKIKQHLFVSSYYSQDDKNINFLLSSWGKRECCEWIGVQCSNISGHVIKLDLSRSTFDMLDDDYQLKGNISSSLVDLKHLTHLDLSEIYFGQFSSIPGSIGSLTKLKYLNLSYTFLGGEIPPQLGNLSNLEFLDLRNNEDLQIKSLNWVSRLSSLQVLELSWTNMSLANDWVHAVTNLPPFLTKLLLSVCKLPDTDTFTPTPSLFNSSQVLQVLDLSGNRLSHSIFQWLFYYSHSLVHLDLSVCLDFKGLIPNGFNNMASLKYLDLHGNNLEGVIPESFGNMISLTYLHLGEGDTPYNYNQLQGFHPESFRNMTALMYLDLSSNQLRGSVPESFGNMISLTYLDLQMNQLDGLNPKSFVNMTAIQYLSLQNNHLQGPIPKEFGNMASLRELDLSNNMLEGDVPKSIWNICTLRVFRANNNSLTGELLLAQPHSSMPCANFSLTDLDLSQNKIKGFLPNFTLYPYLSTLLLSSNQFSGVSESIGQLSKLEFMAISGNSIQGVLSEAHFARLSNLLLLDLSANTNLTVKVPFNWIPPFRLQYIRLGSCKLGPNFPKWLQTQKDNYLELNVSNSGISDSLPDWLWDFRPELQLLDLSNNEFRGNLNERVNFSYVSPLSLTIDLSSNQLQGPIPSFLFQALFLNLLSNSFTQLSSLCNFTESIPLAFLDVSYNQLSGELPDCWSQTQSLRVLVLANNNLSGKIPVSIGFLTSISILHLGNNNLTAELPSSLMNCVDLKILDVGENKLSGPIPAWIGTSLAKLFIISLRSNHFSESIPPQLCHSVNLQLLDFSSNDLSGEIPKCLGNITAMKEIDSDGDLDYVYQIGRTASVPQDFIDEKLVLIWKRAISEFRNIRHLKNIDLSSNKFTGVIPGDISKLVGLISLNLSRNNLSGYIPQDIGQLKSLDALDLSNNHLFGQIPLSLSQVDRLSTLDLSSNDLSGEIPPSTQLQTRDASDFMGNPQLCGDPLPKKCSNEEKPSIFNGDTKDGDINEFVTRGFYISLALGFIVGFWGLCGTLIFSKSLRYAFLKLLDDTGDWFYVTKEIHKRSYCG